MAMEPSNRCFKIAEYTTFCVNKISKLQNSYACSPLEADYLQFLERLASELDHYERLNRTGNIRGNLQDQSG